MIFRIGTKDSESLGCRDYNPRQLFKHGNLIKCMLWLRVLSGKKTEKGVASPCCLKTSLRAKKSMVYDLISNSGCNNILK